MIDRIQTTKPGRSLLLLGVFALFVGALSVAKAETIPTLPDEIRRADLVAIIKVTDLSKTVVTNSSLSQITNYTAKAVVERAFKGRETQAISIKDDDRIPRLERGVGATYIVFLKKVGDQYEPVDGYSVTGVYGKDPETAHVGWYWGCPTLPQAVKTLEKLVAKQAAEKP